MTILVIRVERQIQAERISSLLVGAMENNPHTAEWCFNYELVGFTAGLYDPRKPWYDQPSLMTDPNLRVDCIVDAGDGMEQKRRITALSIRQGLQLMADSHSRHFNDFDSENDDAITSDVFLQCILLKDVVFG